MKTLNLSLIFFLSFFLLPSLSLAISPSPTATQSAAQSDIKVRVDKIKQTNDPTLQTMMKDIKTDKFGIVGTIQKSLGASLQVRTYTNNLRVIELHKDATYWRAGKQIKKEELELNTPVIVMGYIENGPTYIGRRVILVDDTVFPSTRYSLTGNLSALTSKSLTLGISLLVKTSSQTKYLSILGSPINRTDIKTNDPLVAIFDKQYTASTSALRIYSLSPKATELNTLTPSPLPKKVSP